ncbi:tripeptidyl peptidase sed3 [Colletotrichum plurivorum]|uniref:tripeptidyl-peptidase II n=1 Tax=Colletotrichum plurivorum TaxID=2175906 RepID=A0A8H6K6P2_9PEZI|nr:tripeptidyl peptidase sed3 [Colletotrichum plurivorum]
MRNSTFFWLLISLVAFSSLFALSLAALIVEVEGVGRIPERWRLQGRKPDASQSITLSIALKQPNVASLKSRLEEISNPNSPEYGKHLSKEEVDMYRSPDSKGASEVMSWLASSGVREAAHVHDRVVFNSTVADAEGLLNASLGYYSSEGDDKKLLRTLAYSVPTEVSSAIDFIRPLEEFRPTSGPRAQFAWLTQRAEAKKSGAGDQCNGGTDPTCIKSLYKLNYNASTARSPVRFGIAGFLEQYINYEDTSTFMDRYAPDRQDEGFNFTVELVNGGRNPQDINSAGTEASLDIQYAMALGYPTNVVYYSTGGRGTKLDGDGLPYHDSESDNEPYIEFLDYLLDLPDEDLPHVLSISYADDEMSVPKAYAIRACDMFAALTARGVSILAASGDGGSRGTGQRMCYSNDGKGTEMTVPTFPASCPYVTSVGATTNSGPPVNGAGFSTGGFSNYFSQPAWQTKAVDKYFKALDGRLQGHYNASGRAIPDISAIGSGFAIQWAGRESSVLGTSASCPVVAAMVALANDARMREGKSSIGWLNPLLYSKKARKTLQDVVEGESYSCSWNGDAPGGWPAKPGYDTITGLGVPDDFKKFMKVLTK